MSTLNKFFFCLPFLLLGALLLVGCNGDDNTTTDISSLESFEAFGDEGFNYAESIGLQSSNDISVEDGVLGDDNSIYIIGQPSASDAPSLIKLDSQCEFDFSRPIFNNNAFGFRKMDLLNTADQNYLSSNRTIGLSSSDVNLTKYGPNGNTIWSSTLGSPNIEEGVISTAETSEGEIVVLAEELTNSLFGLDTCYFIFRVDQDGELISRLWIEDSDKNQMHQILYIEADNTILLLGNYGYPGSGTLQSYLKVSKYSLGGDLLSSKILLDERDMTFDISDMNMLEDGSIIVYTSSNGANDRNNTTIQVFKINTNLDVIWSYFYDDVSSNIAKDIQETNTGDLIILSDSGSLSQESIDFDIVLTSINQDLEINWIKSYGTSSSDQGSKLLIEDNGDINVIGNSNHETDFESIFRYFVLKTDSEGFPK